MKQSKEFTDVQSHGITICYRIVKQDELKLKEARAIYGIAVASPVDISKNVFFTNSGSPIAAGRLFTVDRSNVLRGYMSWDHFHIMLEKLFAEPETVIRGYLDTFEGDRFWEWRCKRARALRLLYSYGVILGPRLIKEIEVFSGCSLPEPVQSAAVSARAETGVDAEVVSLPGLSPIKMIELLDVYSKRLRSEQQHKPMTLERVRSFKSASSDELERHFFYLKQTIQGLLSNYQGNPDQWGKVNRLFASAQMILSFLGIYTLYELKQHNR